MFFRNILFAITILFALPCFGITIEDIKKLHENYSEDNTLLLQKFEEIEPQIKLLPTEEQNKFYEEFFIKINYNEKFYTYYKNYKLGDDFKSQYINYYISFFLNDIDKIDESLIQINKYDIINLKSEDLKVNYITLKSIIRNKQGAYYESLVILDEADKIIDNIKYINTTISFLSTKATIYYYLKDYENSNKYNSKIINLYDENKINIDLSYIYILNNMYYNQPKDEINKKFIIEKLDFIISKNQDKNILAMSYYIYGQIVSSYKDPSQYYNKSISLYNELGINEEIFYTKIEKAKYLFESNPHNLQNTEELRKVLEDIFTEDSRHKIVFRLKSGYYKRLHDYENSLKYLEIYKYKHGEDFNKKFTTTVEDLKVMFDTVNREEDNLNLVRDKREKEFKIKEEKELALEKNKQLFYSFLILSVILFIIITFIYFYKKMKEEATIDDLTKVYNRKSILAIGENSFTEYERTFSVILLDIDYFKKINDTYGHEIGDKVLFEFSQLIKQNLRKDDFLGRYGGEEFLIVTPSNINAAYEMAERLRKNVMEYQFDCADLKITSSFGVVCYHNHSTFEQMLKDVDEMLYVAKNNGRNKVVKKETK